MQTILPNKRSFRRDFFSRSILFCMFAGSFSTAYANPDGSQVISGSATVNNLDSTRTTITQTSDKAVIHWQDFSVNENEITEFKQPNSSSITLNRVVGNNASKILGKVTANGKIILTNPNGIVFGKSSKVDAAGLIATTHQISDEDFKSDHFNFKKVQNHANASIVNEGEITIKEAGVAAFVAPHVKNNGVIIANGGKVNLASGEGFAVDLYGDGLISYGINDDIKDTLKDENGLPIEALVENNGTITASQIALSARTARTVINQAVNVKGNLNASSISQKGGKIIISSEDADGHASGQVNITNAHIDASGVSGGDATITGEQINITNSTITASGKENGGNIKIGGDKHGGGNLARAKTTNIDKTSTISADATGNHGSGGNVVVWSDHTTDYQGTITAKAGQNSGNGGFAEVSSKGLLKFKGNVDLSAPNGNVGTFLLDPQNIIIQSSVSSPFANCSGGVCTPTGNDSILLVSDLETLLGNSNVVINTGVSGAQAGNITVANNISWSTANRLSLDAYGSITINSGVTIANTYNGSMVNTDLPVLLSLRADATGVNNGGSFTNNGTINFSGSTGAVSIFYDRAAYGGTYTAGTQTTNGAWVAPTSLSLNSQFTAYQLVNTVSDLAAINSGLSGNYALGKNIAGGGAAFNSDTPMGTFTGRLDGQYCQLAGGSNCSISGLTMNAAAATTNVGLFGINNGTIRNLSLGMDVTQNYTGATNNNVGILAGSGSGTVANVSTSGNVNYTFSGSGTSSPLTTVGGMMGASSGTIRNASSANSGVSFTLQNSGTGTPTHYVGGLIGQYTGTSLNTLTSSSPISYFHKSTSTGASLAYLGGLIGFVSGAATLNTASSSGTVAASYVSGYTGNSGGYIGGLIGQAGNNGAASFSNVSASGNVSSTLKGGNNYIGGLIGYLYSTLTTSGSPSLSGAFTTNDVSYDNSSNASSSVRVGGLVGYTQAGWINNSYATGDVSATSPTGSYVGGLVGSTVSGISNSYATGDVTHLFTGSAAGTSYAGGLAGYSSGAITDSYSQTGAVTVTTQNSTTTAHTNYIGGLVGQYAGSTLSTLSSSNPVSYLYKGTSTGISVANLGGLIGFLSTAANLSTTSSASGSVTAGYVSGYTGTVNGYLGGLIGQNGNNTITSLSNVSASGNVTNTLNGNLQYNGGLIGYSSSTGTIGSSSATGNVSYIGTATTSAVGGFVGYDDRATSNFSNNTSSGRVANTSTATTSYLGGFAGLITGTLTGSSSSNTFDVIGTSSPIGSTAHAFYIGGQVGFLTTGSFSNITSPVNVSYIYNGTSTGTSSVYMGGLAGYLGTTSGSFTNNSTSGTVTANYASGYNGNIHSYIGGLIGQAGNNTAVALSNISASGNVSSTLKGGNNYIGGLIGWLNSSLITSGSPALTGASSTNSVTYENSSTSTSNNVGGLIGYLQRGWVNSSSATGNVSANSATAASVGGLVGNAAGGISNSYATGAVSHLFTGSAAGTSNVGGLAGYSASPITDSYSQTGAVSVTTQNSTTTAHTNYIGGLVGQYAGSTLSTLSSSNPVSYLYKGTSTGTSTTYMGGLIGSMTTAVNLNTTSSASGTVTAGYAPGYIGNVNGYLGGLTGQAGNNTAVALSNVSASGNVSSTLKGGSNYLGGLVGLLYSNLTTSGSPALSSAHATGSVIYDNSTNSSTNAYVGGLVGYAQTGWTDNSDATGNVSVTAPIGGYAGGLIGSAVGGISNSNASGNISYLFTGSGNATTYAGGLAGYSSGNITNSYSQTGSINATTQNSSSSIHTNYIGGLVGQYAGSTLSAITSTNPVSYLYKGTSTGISVANLGGLIGWISTALSLNGSSSASGSVTASYVSGYTGNASTYVGGLIGQNGNNTATSIANVSATGNVMNTLNGTTSHNGGLIGYNNSTGTIADSNATGNVSYNGVATTTSVGGFVGYDERATSIFTNNQSSGSVSNNSSATSSATYYLGGFAGRISGTSNNSYSTNTSNINATGGISGTAVFSYYLGGQMGYANAATFSNLSTPRNVSFLYNGTSTGTSTLYQGGLFGYLNTNSGTFTNNSTSGTVTAGYTSGYNGNLNGYIGGLIGQAGNNTAVALSNVSASGNVSSTLKGGNNYIGGLIGWLNSSLITSGSPALTGASSTNSVTYENSSTSTSNSVGGLIGYLQRGWVNSSSATGNVSVNSATAASVGGLVGNAAGGISNSYATGAVSHLFTGSAAGTSNVGGLAGYSASPITDSYSQTGAVSVTTQNSTTTAHTNYIGGLVGQYAGSTLSTLSSSNPVSYLYKGTSTGTSAVTAGGLVGYISTALALNGSSSASGTVTAEYAPGYIGNVHGYLGGLVGQAGANNAISFSDVSASGNVRSTLKGGNNFLGGLIGYLYSSLNTSASPALNNTHTTNTVTYENSTNTSAQNNIGGLVGYAVRGWINNSDSTGDVSVTSATGAAMGGLVGSASNGGISNSYATGDVYNIFTGTGASTSSVGGLAGYNANAINNSYSNGAVNVTNQNSGTSAFTSYLGGMIGQQTTGDVTDSYSTANVSYLYKGTSTGTSPTNIGGLFGIASNTATNANTYATGNVLVSEEPGYIGNLAVNAGGFAGAANTGVKLMSGYANGNVNDTTSGTTHYLGGYVGTGGINTLNAQANGNVYYRGTATYAAVGGFAGRTSGTFTNSTASGDVGNTYTGVGSVNSTSLLGGFGGYMYSTIVNSKSTNPNPVIGISEAGGTGVNSYQMGGQFGWIESNTLQDISSNKDVIYLYKGTASTRQNAILGGITGVSLVTNMINVSSSGDLTAKYFDSDYSGIVDLQMGGIIGQSYQWFNPFMNITGSHATGNLRNELDTGYHFVGGLVAWSYATGGLLSDNYATGNITNLGAGGGYTGGLIGVVSGGNISNSYATGNITYAQTAPNNGELNIGGLIGNMQGIGGNTFYAEALGGAGANYFSVTDVYSTGDINYTLDEYTSGFVNIGGSIGKVGGGYYDNIASSGSLAMTYNGTSDAAQINTGGFAGSITSNGAILNDSMFSSQLNLISSRVDIGNLGLNMDELSGLSENFISDNITNSTTLTYSYTAPPPIIPDNTNSNTGTQTHAVPSANSILDILRTATALKEINYINLLPKENLITSEEKNVAENSITLSDEYLSQKPECIVNATSYLNSSSYTDCQ